MRVARLLFASYRAGCFQALGLAISLQGCARPDPDKTDPDTSGGARPVGHAGHEMRCREEARGLGVRLPARAAGYCLDARVDARRFGFDAPLGLDAICGDLFAGSCDEEKSFGLESLETLQFARESGPRIEVHVRVSQFTRARGAYAFFAARVLGERSPARGALRRLNVAGRGASAGGVAYLWSGRRVVELRAGSTSEPPDRVEAISQRELPELAARVARPPGEALPYEVGLLETPELEGPVVRLVEEELLELPGSGGGAVGQYVTSSGAHQELIAVRRDEGSAKDFLALLARELAGHWLQNKTVLRGRRARAGASPETWYFARHGRVVIGAGPGPSPLPLDRASVQDRAEGLLTRLQHLLARVRASPPPPER